MLIKQHIPLSELTTIKIGAGATASVVVTITNPNELLGALQQIKASGHPYRVLGWGSNVIARDEGFHGVIILNKISGFEVLDETPEGALIRAGAGETLDTVVARTVEMGLSGIEALSSIPGTIGAAPVQNAGAYGQEIGDTLVTVEGIDTQTLQPFVLTKEQCGFSYRDSIFKHNDRRYVITSVSLRLARTNPEPPFYKSLSTYFEQHDITAFTPQVIRDAVIAIRKEKLPSPLLLPNAGSFFKNPIVDRAVADALVAQWPDAPVHPMKDGTVKVPAGWLVEQAGLKGYENGPLRTYAKNALVIVNAGEATYKDLNEFRTYIQRTVKEKFAIDLQQEPEEL